MIREQPAIRLLSLWVETPEAGRLLLGRDQIGVGRLGSGTSLWKSYLASATSVNVQRGGSRNGLSVGMQVGTMTITFREASLGGNADFLPQRGIRLSNLGDSQPFFTGTIVDVDYKHVRDERLKRLVRIVTIVAVDAVQKHANVTRFGASAMPAIGETWENRIRRLAASATSPVVTPTEPAAVVKYTLPVTENLDGWAYFGIVQPGQTLLPIEMVTDSLAVPPEDRVMLKRVMDSTAARPVTAGSTGVRRTLTGLTPGRRYELSGWFAYMGAAAPTGTGIISAYRFGVTGKGWGEPGEAFERRAEYPIPSYSFRADSETHEVLVSSAYDMVTAATFEVEALGLTQFTVTEVATASGEFMANTYMEASLADHFDIASMSGGASWWVDSTGLTRFAKSPPGTSPVATFTDKRTAGQLEYIDLEANFDTRSIVNYLKTTNRTIGRDENGELVADDREEVFIDLTSVGTWGPRAGSVDLTVLDDGPYRGDLEGRARSIMEERGQAGYTPHRIQWNAQEKATTVPLLDVYAPVNIVAGGVTYPMRIINITHEITPTRWLVTLELIGR